MDLKSIFKLRKESTAERNDFEYRAVFSFVHAVCQPRSRATACATEEAVM